MSWSFRKDCIGFARSILDPSFDRNPKKKNKKKKEEIIREEREEEEEEDGEESLNRLICILIGYFVSTVSHDVDEWLTWGVPFVGICVDAVGLDASLTSRIREKFMGTVGRGYMFVFEDEDEDDDDEEVEDGEERWTHITPLKSFLSSMATKLALHEEKCGGIQPVLDNFLSTMNKAVTLAKYDTRTRVLISRRICNMFQLESGEAVSDENSLKIDKAQLKSDEFKGALINNLSGQLSSSTCSETATIVVPSFHTEVQPHQVAAAVNSFRALKVGVAAATGGALMFCAGGLAAPSMMTSMVASLTGMTSAGTTSVFFANLAALLNAYGMPVITSAATTLGTTVASWKMMRRTDPLKEFALEPLHAPHTKDLSGTTILVASPEGYRNERLERPLFSRVFNDSAPPPEAQEIYLLVPGHYSGQKDLRELWGGDLDLDLDDDNREGASAGANFRVTCRPTSASLKPQPETKRPKSSASCKANIKKGWWRQTVSNNSLMREEDSDYQGGEPYIVRWDTAELIRLFNAQQSFLLERSVTVAVEEILKYASPVIGAAALPITVLERATELDCPWLVAMDRAEQAGRLLAALLLENASAPQLSSDSEHQMYRQRSINLVGYGFGARVVFQCAKLLASAPDGSGHGIIQDMVLIGAPLPSDASGWGQVRRVVSGRLVNCYKRNDCMLGLMYRSKSWEVGIAGLEPIRLHESLDEDQNQIDLDENSESHAIRGESSLPLDIKVALRAHDPSWRTDVENIDISDLVSSHLQYGESLRPILERVRLNK